jgi:hypothetical protein
MDISKLDIFSDIDFGAIDLPSDGITLKHLRRRFPNRAEFVADREGERLDAMWDAERLFVLMGYTSVLGNAQLAKVEACIPDQAGKAALARDLTTDLIHYGLADGPATAAQTIRQLEEIGAVLARQRQGRLGR